MARTKQRSMNPYLGRRRNRRIMKQKQEVMSTPQRIDPHEDPQEGSSSTSARKMNLFGITLDSIQCERKINEGAVNEIEDCFFIAQLSSLVSLLTKVLCPVCKSQSVQFELSNSKANGFAMKGQLNCTTCNESIVEDYLCQRVGGAKSTRAPFEVNSRATLAFRGIGCGFSAMKEWCGVMNMPYAMSQDAYTAHHNKIHKASIEMAKILQDDSAKPIREAYKDIGVLPDKNGFLEIAVSFDGAWHRRGHSSHNGLASTIDLLTGIPTDFEVLSNFCLKCKIATEKPDDPEWREKHAANCPKNFTGSSNAMEVECALRLWNRSEERHKLRYTTMLCDGDSKAFDAVLAAVPYGPDVKIEKEDCVNHVSKRMGTALRNIVATSKAQKDSISGKGKLTQEKMTKIQNYYGRAIKDNANDVDLLKKRIFAIIFHLSSSDLNPKHTHCPPGDKSWCFWQRAVAQSKDPGSHKEHDTLPADIGKKLVPIFLRLSDSDLLKRCSRNRTQNPNESLHHLIWQICPKATFAGRQTVETAVAFSVCQFTLGASFRHTVCKLLGIEPGDFLQKSSSEKDISRIKKAEKAGKETTKKRRRALKYKKSAQEQKKQSNEGTTYASGSFNVQAGNIK
eukprot:Seg1311.5 transcript_id=Seg1311.5/GoldUCD/mRNA.D3Y31 product="hypothetical protein" protein_id=Seg1311.5/GoldUCD/D3Y31